MTRMSSLIALAKAILVLLTLHRGNDNADCLLTFVASRRLAVMQALYIYRHHLMCSALPTITTLLHYGYFFLFSLEKYKRAKFLMIS